VPQPHLNALADEYSEISIIAHESKRIESLLHADFETD